jgi:hypothetical protein
VTDSTVILCVAVAASPLVIQASLMFGAWVRGRWVVQASDVEAEQVKTAIRRLAQHANGFVQELDPDMQLARAAECIQAAGGKYERELTRVWFAELERAESSRLNRPRKELLQ